MKSSAKKVELASVDDLFSTEESRADAQRERVMEIPLSELHPFKNHPFKVKDDDAMMETADSVRQYGVLVPAIARPDPEGGYELVAGHRRHRASELAEKETMPVIVRDLDDDAATIIMVDSNLQRESLLPSERAFAYRMKLEAMNHQGKRADLTCGQVGHKSVGQKSRDLLAEQTGESARNIQRYIRLTELRAPFDGIIGLRNISEGAYASPSSVVAKLTKRSPIKIEFYVPERYSNQIRKGTPLTFEVEGVLKSFPAVVYAVESQVENETRKFPVRAIYPNTNNELMPGRYVNVRIRMAEIPDAIAVPSEALVPELGIDKVFLYKNGKAQPVAVETGLRTDAMVQIIKGLQMGDTVITSGTLQLRTDLPVKLDRID